MYIKANDDDLLVLGLDKLVKGHTLSLLHLLSILLMLLPQCVQVLLVLLHDLDESLLLHERVGGDGLKLELVHVSRLLAGDPGQDGDVTLAPSAPLVGRAGKNDLLGRDIGLVNAYRLELLDPLLLVGEEGLGIGESVDDVCKGNHNKWIIHDQSNLDEVVLIQPRFCLFIPIGRERERTNKANLIAGNKEQDSNQLTGQLFRYVDLQLNVAKEHGQGHGKVALGPEGNVSVARLQVLEGQDPLTQHLVVVVVDGKPEHGQFRQNNLKRH